MCSCLRGTIPAGVPPCSSSGLTGTGFLHLDPVWLVFAGLAVFQKTEDDQQKRFWDVPKDNKMVLLVKPRLPRPVAMSPYWTKRTDVDVSETKG